jgi:hypothetical protein
VLLGSVFFVVGGAAHAARGYTDRAGDVARGSGPDLLSIRISSTRTSLTFRVRFAHAPPLRGSAREHWVDMLLLGIDVPPLGPRPTEPGGEWPGADYALGAHAPATKGLLVRLGDGAPASRRRVGTFGITITGATMTFSISRRSLGSLRWFTFSVAAARETDETDGGSVDLAPARGTYRYRL